MTICGNSNRVKFKSVFEFYVHTYNYLSAGSVSNSAITKAPQVM